MKPLALLYFSSNIGAVGPIWQTFLVALFLKGSAARFFWVRFSMDLFYIGPTFRG
jgi:hypothetical protein